MPCWAAMALFVCRVEASNGTCFTLAMRPMVKGLLGPVVSSLSFQSLKNCLNRVVSAPAGSTWICKGYRNLSVNQAEFSASNIAWKYMCRVFWPLLSFKSQITSRPSSFLSEKAFKYMSVLPVSYWSIPCLWWTADLLPWLLYALTCSPWDLVGVK